MDEGNSLLGALASRVVAYEELGNLEVEPSPIGKSTFLPLNDCLRAVVGADAVESIQAFHPAAADIHRTEESTLRDPAWVQYRTQARTGRNRGHDDVRFAQGAFWVAVDAGTQALL